MKNVKNFLAKSNGETLIEHSNKVLDVTINIAKRILSNDMFNYYSKLLTHASLLHDIGKLTDSFQKKLVDSENKSGKTFRHNEIGWAFLSKYYVGEYKNDLLYLVFWHHGISNQLSKINDDKVIDVFSDVEIKRMSDYLIDVVGENYLDKPDDYFDNKINKAPHYHSIDGNDFRLKILYGCLVSGDRIASGDYDNLKKTLDNYFNLSREYNPIANWEYSGSKRSQEQIEIVNNCSGTTMLNAPAGFGKTTMGLLWGLKRNRKIIWVCPRNTVADSVYEGVIGELNVMNISPSIELVLGGEIKRGGNGNMFDSDIIIINIDNYLAPSNNNTLLKYYSLINGCSVIFDEYHELIGEMPLFSMFINIMKGRNLISKSETLLLSATPNLINPLWEGTKLNRIKTQILPKQGEHFNAQHNEPFKLITYHSDKILNINNSSSLVIYNSIRNAQIEKLNGNYNKLYHSKFSDNERSKNLKFLLDEYGKNGNENGNIIGTHVLQASLDISFKYVYESCLSPDSTLQRLGRNNRWGRQINAEFNSILLENKSEKSMGEILYERNLQNIWFGFINNYNGQTITLNKIYSLYNQFYCENKITIAKQIKFLHKTSLESLNKIHPIKFNITSKNKDGIITSGGNKLRSSGNEIFYIVKNVNDDGWSDIFSERVIGGFDEYFKESNNTLIKMIKTMKKLRNNLDSRFDFNGMLNIDRYSKNGLTIDKIRRNARKSNTPYIRFDKVYDNDLGVISDELYYDLKKINLVK